MQLSLNQVLVVLAILIGATVLAVTKVIAGEVIAGLYGTVIGAVLNTAVVSRREANGATRLTTLGPSEP